GGMRSLVAQLTRLPPEDPALDLPVLAALVEPTISAAVDRLIDDLDELRAAASAPPIATNEPDLLAAVGRCARLIEGAERLSLGDVPSGGFKALASRAAALSDAFAHADAAARRLGTLFGLNQPPTCDEALHIVEAVSFIGSVPAQHRRAVLPDMDQPQLRRLIDE